MKIKGVKKIIENGKDLKEKHGSPTLAYIFSALITCSGS